MKRFEVNFMWGAIVDAETEKEAIEKSAEMLNNLNSKELSNFGEAYEYVDTPKEIRQWNIRKEQ